MSPPSLAPLVFLRILANPGGAPSALLLEPGCGLAEALLPLFAQPQITELSEQLLCLYPDNLAPEPAAALAAAQWEPIAPAALFHTDTPVDETALPAGASWIEGNWCMAARPKPVGTQAASRARSLQLVQLVMADADTDEIEALLRQDPQLSYQLLRLVNSLGVGVGRRITSFAQAILILGRQQLRRWLNLMLFAARDGDPRSAMLLARVAVRARMLEQLAKSLGMAKNMQDQAFMTGMFSLLDVLFGETIEAVLAPLSLGAAVHDALLEHYGELGALLHLIETAEQGQLASVASQLELLHLTPAQFNAAVLDAHCWMLLALRSSQAGPDG